MFPPTRCAFDDSLFTLHHLRLHPPGLSRLIFHLARFTSHILLFTFPALFCSCYDLYDYFTVKLTTSEVVNAREVATDSTARPMPGEKMLSFFVMGDAGTGGVGQVEVADGMTAAAAREPAAFVVCLGDNFYENGVESVSDPQFKESFEEIYTSPQLQIPFYAVLGNHDYRGNAQAQVEYTAHGGRWRMSDRNYTVKLNVDDSTDITLFCIDTYPLAEANGIVAGGSPEARQIRWLDSSLSVSTSDWKLVFGHHTLYSGGAHGDNPALAGLLEPLFVKHCVHTYFCGHDHHLEMLKPVNGVHFVISGSGGKHRDVNWRESTLFAATNLGFVRCSVSASRMIVEFYDRDGVQLHAASLPRRGAQ